MRVSVNKDMSETVFVFADKCPSLGKYLYFAVIVK